MNKVKEITYFIIVVAAIWVSITSGIQRLVCDSLTETQLLKKIPKNVMLDFQHCDNHNDKAESAQ